MSGCWAFREIMYSPLVAGPPYRLWLLAALFVSASGVVGYPLVVDVHRFEIAQVNDYVVVVLVSVFTAGGTVALATLGARSQARRVAQVASSILIALITSGAVLCVVLAVMESQFDKSHRVWTSVWSSTIYSKMLGTLWPLLAVQGLARLVLLWPGPNSSLPAPSR
jgi:hypothetical protein